MNPVCWTDGRNPAQVWIKVDPSAGNTPDNLRPVCFICDRSIARTRARLAGSPMSLIITEDIAAALRNSTQLAAVYADAALQGMTA